MPGVHSGNLILVNARHPLTEQRRPLLAPAIPGSGVLLESHAAAMLTGALGRIGALGDIVPVSGWRSRREQQEIWDSTMAESGGEFTRKYVALPGCSEHETGLAIDLALRAEEIDFIRPDFPRDGVCGRFRAIAADYGFIERYPAGKEHITGIAAEPWHFRYVGRPHAHLMAELGLTLEEYVELLRSYPYPGGVLSTESGGYGADIGFTSSYEPSLAPSTPYQVSGNNVDGYILTLWRLPA